MFRIAFFWLALTYVLHTVAELLISPIGLSMITKLSAPKVVGLDAYGIAITGTKSIPE